MKKTDRKGWEIPEENDQSNFGSGYGYQFGFEADTIEVLIDDNWRIFQQGSWEGKIHFEKEWFDKGDLSEETLV